MSEAISNIKIITRVVRYRCTHVDLNVSDHIKNYVEGLPHIPDRSIVICISTQRGIHTDVFARNITREAFVEINRRLNLVGRRFAIFVR